MRLVLALSICLLSSSAAAEGKSYVCRGDVGNGYNTTRPEYKVFGSRTFYITTRCSKRGAPCDYFFEGSRHEGYLYEDGGMGLTHLGPFNIIGLDGFLTFKMSQNTNGVGGNEGQRWFRGMCKED